MSFFNKLLNQAAEALRSPAPSVEGAPFQFDDSAASTILVEPPSKILENAVRELQGMGEGNLGRKLEMLSDIHRSLVEDARTKDLFRDEGGFLALISVLSGLRPAQEEEDLEGSGVLVDLEVEEVQRVECLRMVLWCLCESMSNHVINRKHFEETIGYTALSSAIALSEMLEAPSCDHTFSFLLSFAHSDFSLSDLYPSIRRTLASLPPSEASSPEVYQPIVDHLLTSLQKPLSTLYFPQPLLLLLEAQEILPESELALGYALLKTLERVASANQRNNILLSQMSFVSIIVPRVFGKSSDDATVGVKGIFGGGEQVEHQKGVLLKLARRVIEAGTTHAEARALFHLAVKEDDSLDDEVMDLVRHGMKSRWPGTVNMWGRSWIECRSLGVRGFTKDSKGYTSMAWIYLGRLDTRSPLPLLDLLDPEGRSVLTITIESNGQVSLASAGVPKAIFEGSAVPQNRWVLIGVVGKRSKLGGGDAALLIDGKRSGAIKFPYPQIQNSGTRLTARIGSSTASTSSPKDQSRWNLGPAYLFSEALPDDMLFLIHHLGPRYAGNFQVVLGSFLTYEASTALNTFLSTIAKEAAGRATDAGNSRLARALKDGGAIDEASIIFAFSADNLRTVEPVMGLENQPEVESVVLNGAIPKLETAKVLTRGLGLVMGDAVVAPGKSMDEEIWGMGGCAPMLRLVELAKTTLQLSSAVSICIDALRESWRNSEDMERSHGYEILARLLDSKMASLMTVETQRILFNSLGLHLEKPETSTIYNATAYRYLILAFDLWAKAPKDLQIIHLSHFRDLVKTSKFRRFNLRQRLFKKMAVVRKLLFALRAGYYEDDIVPVLIETLFVIADHHFSTDDTIKPLIAYLVSSLCPASSSPTPSAKSTAHAILVLEATARLLRTPSHLAKIHANLPLHRVLLLFLANNPTAPVIAASLDIISCLVASPQGESFGRKFDAEGGFTLLTRILPPVWNSLIHDLSFAVLLGRPISLSPDDSSQKVIVCSLIFPAILAAIEGGLEIAGDLVQPVRVSTSSSVVESNDSVMSSVVSTNHPASTTLWEDTTKNIKAIKRLLVSSQSFGKLVRSRKVISEQLVQNTSLFLSKSAFQVPDEYRERVQILRAAIFQLLGQLLRSRIPGPLQAEIHKLLPSNFLEPDRSNLGTSPGPVSMLQRRISLQRRTTSESFESLAESISSKQGIDRRMTLTRGTTDDFKFQASKDRNHAWRSIILSVEANRFSRAAREIKNDHRRIDTKEWPHLRSRLDQERGLWPSRDPEPDWRLDGSEGPMRQRIRLERAVRDAQDGSSSFHPKRGPRKERVVDEEIEEPMSAIDPVGPAAPWEDPFVLGAEDATGDEKSFRDVEDVENLEALSLKQRFKQCLETGDLVEETQNSVRIVGVDALPGLFVLGKLNLYLLDGLGRTDAGEIVEASNLEQDVFSVPGTIANVDTEEKTNHQWKYEDVIESSKRTFLFREVGLELYFRDSVNFLLVFPTRKKRDLVHARLQAKTDPSLAAKSAGGFLMSRVGKSLATALSGKLPELEDATQRWVNRSMSNFAYLTVLNQIANRTPNDVTQYPVFPWVLRDYTSDELDLTKKESFRNLTMPMGALTPARRESAADRYTNIALAGEQPFHYGTHFSSSMIVAGFLIRQSPFTEMFKVLQGGNFDLADRLFSSIPQAWESASRENRGDVRELIGSFFCGNGEFLINENHHDFGFKQGGGLVDDVELPKWARDDPLLFVTKHRAALESNFVSTHLPAWIDLIFGYLQRDQKHLNAFHPFSYAGAIDLDKISDPNERAATVGIIHNFGQTPRKIFESPHPRRAMFGKPGLPVGVRYGVSENFGVLIQSRAPVNVLKFAVSTLLPRGLRLRPWPDQRLPIPGRSLIVEWGFAGGGLRIFSEDHRVISITEWCSVEQATFVDDKTLVTGSVDGVISFWKVLSGEKPSLELTESLVGHGDLISSLAVSKAWSLLVSGSRNGNVLLWDLNRIKYIRTIYSNPDTPVHLLAVNENNGHIALCHSSTIELYTINGAFICSTLTAHPSDPILSVAFFDTREWSAIQIVATGHSKGKIVLWSLTADGTPVGEKAIWQLTPLRTIHYRGGDTADVTSLRFWGESLLAGDALGRVFLFALPDGGAENVPDSTPACQNGAHTTFGLLEQRRFCGGCGGCFCGSCCQNVPRFEGRFCPECRVALALGLGNERDHFADIDSHLEPEAGSRRASLVVPEPGRRRASIISIDTGTVSARRETLLGGNVGRSISPSPFGSTTSLSQAPPTTPILETPASSIPPRSRSSTSTSRHRSPSPRGDPLEALRGRGRTSSNRSSSKGPSPLSTPTTSRRGSISHVAP